MFRTFTLSTLRSLLKARSLGGQICLSLALCCAAPLRAQNAAAQLSALKVPAGFQIQVFYEGSRLSKPRFLAFSPDSVLHVANKTSGQIVALPDKNRDGKADTAIVAASNLANCHDIRFFRGSMYVTQERQVVKLTDANKDGVYESRSVFIDSVASGARLGGGGHDTRTLVFDSTKNRAYLSIGSSCNVCREENRGVILVYDLNGKGGQVFAAGVRNAVGMTLHPRTGRLWATNNGPDRQGDDIPREWIDLVRENGFYGWPFAWGTGTYFNFNAHSDYTPLLPITAADSALVRKMVQPAAEVTAHSAPMAIEFANSSFPAAYRRGAFVALRGSWNRTVPTGYKVVYLDFDNDQDTTANQVSDFLTGPIESKPWGRPVGLESDLRGSLYVTSDAETQAIYRIFPTSSTRVKPVQKGAQRQKQLKPRSSRFRIRGAEGTTVDGRTFPSYSHRM